jgi:hypothetical protein
VRQNGVTFQLWAAEAGPPGLTLELALQTTLLSLAIAIILALVAALVGPLLIDWRGYRSVFEAEASYLIGVDVRVTGSIDARLLPSPRLTLHDIAIGSGDDAVSARSLGIEFALGPLMRGQWHAAELHLSGAKLALGTDAKGGVQAPTIPINFNPNTLSIDHLSIEDSTVVIGDTKKSARLTLAKLWFNGDARSLLGPFSGEGAATVDGELYPFRITTGRISDDGVLKVRLNVDPVNRLLNAQADGVITFAAAGPSFDGTFRLARPVGIAGQSAAAPTQPWHVAGKLQATAVSALMQEGEFQYGSDDQGFMLTGTAEFRFYREPSFEAVLSGRQIDLDRTLGVGDAGQSAPAAALRKIADLAGVAFRPTFPIKIGLGIDRVTLGGDAIEAVRGDLSTDAGGWNLDRFEFRAPGFTQVRLSGQLAVGAGGAAFTGPADIEATDPKTFSAWVEGRPAPKKSELKPLKLRGDVTLSSEKLAIEHLTAEFERKPVSGRLVYTFEAGDRAPKLDAALAAPELDIDAAISFGKALLAGSNLARPRQMTVSADIGRASYAGVIAREVGARVKIDGAGLSIDRLSIADLGGGALKASGRIDTGGHAPRGALTLDFDTRQAAAVAALAGRLAARGNPAVVALDRVDRAKLHANLEVAAATSNASLTTAELAVAGDLDSLHIDAHARATGDWATVSATNIQADASVKADDGVALLKLIGLDRIVTAGKGPGELSLKLDGSPKGKMSGLLHLASTGFSVNSRLAVSGWKLALDDIDAKAGATALRGHLTVDALAPTRIDGALAADAVDAENLIAGAIGMKGSAVAARGGWLWSDTPFSGGALGDLAGTVALKAQRVIITPHLTARAFSASIRLGKEAVVFDDMTAEIAAGRTGGRLAFELNDIGLAAHAKITLAGVDVAGLTTAARPPVMGILDADIALDGAGLSPAALAGTLHGGGKFTLRDGQLAGLDPHTFEIVSRAADTGMAPGSSQLSAVVGKALDGGSFPVARSQGEFTVSSGQARFANLTIRAGHVDLSAVGNTDLTDGDIDARFVLSGQAEAGGARPDIYVALNGPLTSPSRTVDVSALTGWLTLRTIESQARKLKEMERAPPPPIAPAVVAPQAPATPQPAAAAASPVLSVAAPVPQPRPRMQQAPALPAAVDIKPLPEPQAARPEALVDPHH